MYIDTQIYTAPPNGAGRLKKEMDTYTLLQELDIPFERLDHSAVAKVDDCYEIEQRLGLEISKNLFLSDGRRTQFYLLMMPGHKRYRAGELSKQLGTPRLSFADEAYLQKHLDLTPGSVSVLGLMNDKDHTVTLLIDRDVLAQEYVGCHPCVNTASLKLRLGDLLDKFLPHTGHQPVFVTLPWK